MLRELAPVRWALIDLQPIGRDESMQLSLSHPRVWRALERDFEPVEVPGLPASLRWLRRR
jgi:hypothetical protein